MHVRAIVAAIGFLPFLAMEALAWSRPPFPGGGGKHHAPEIDGPAGIAALAAVTGIGLYVYNRYKKR